MRETNPKILELLTCGEINTHREEVYFVVTISKDGKLKDRQVAVECRLKRDPDVWVYRHSIQYPLGEIGTISIFGHDQEWTRPFMLSDVMKVSFK